MNVHWVETFWSNVGRERDERATSMLERLYLEGEGAFVEFTVSRDDFAAYLAARMPEERDVTEHLNTIRAPDAYLACACTNGDAAAITRFEVEHQRAFSAVGAKLRLSPSDKDELAQRLRSWLFVATADKAPGISTYGGRGSLVGWLRVVVARSAQKMFLERQREVPMSDANLEVFAPEVSSPERAHLKRRYQTAIVEALREALAELDGDERRLLNRRYAKGETATAIAESEGVHRTTITRRLDDLQSKVMARARVHLANALQIDPGDCDEVLEWVATRFDVTLSRIFESSSGA